MTSLLEHSGVESTEYRFFIQGLCSTGAWHPLNFRKSRLAPTDFEVLTTNLHPRGLFYKPYYFNVWCSYKIFWLGLGFKHWSYQNMSLINVVVLVLIEKIVKKNYLSWLLWKSKLGDFDLTSWIKKGILSSNLLWQKCTFRWLCLTVLKKCAHAKDYKWTNKTKGHQKWIMKF